MTPHPIQIEVRSPEHFDRIQLVLRLGVMILLAALGISGAWVAGLLYLLLPLAAAITISSEGADAYTRDVAPQLWRALRWLLELSAYMMLLTDRFPTADGDSVRSEVRFTAHPSVASAIGRVFTTIPAALVLCLAACFSWVLSVVAVILVLAGAKMPHWILAFQGGVLRWQARCAAYHASIVDDYPSFALESGSARPMQHA